MPFLRFMMDPCTMPQSPCAPLLARARTAERGLWALAALFLATLPLTNPYIRGDGNGYYAYVRSLVIDGDLDFTNEYQYSDPIFFRGVFDADGTLSARYALPNHRARNHWAVGASLLWAPWFLLTHGVVLVLNGLGVLVPADGYSLPYRAACAVGTATYAFVGLVLAYQVARRYAGPRSALLATLGLWFASPLPVYACFLPFHVHALAAFVVSVFVWAWLRTRDDGTRAHWAQWGFLSGLMIEVYYLHAVLLVIPLLELLRTGGGRWGRVGHGLAFAFALLVALVPHFLVKWVVYGSPLNTGYQEEFFWSSPRLWQVAFAAEHGMFLWTPVLAPAAVGLLLLWRRDRSLGRAVLLAFGTFYYVVASYQNWHGQSSFGNRFFVSLTPFFVLGLAVFLDAAWPAPRPAWPLGLVLGGLILWNAGLMFQWGANVIPHRGPVDLAVVARNQVTVVPARAAAFLLRYLGQRSQVTKEIELEDLEAAVRYAPQR
jgi:hypothetical protein